MPLKESEVAVSLVLDRDYYENTVKTAAKESDMSVNQLIRRALKQYIEGSPEDPRLPQIANSYDKLNENGKAWLYDCSLAAIGKAEFKA